MGNMATFFSWRRMLYTLAVYGIAPLMPLYLLWRARRQPEYARAWGERFAWCYGAARRSTAERRVWLHAVSLGETRAAQPLVDAFLAEQPHAHIILTHTTPTGRAAGQALFAAYLADGRMTQVYVPYDLPDVLARFLRRFAPTDCWLMETEIWPNMIAACGQRNIPVSLLNGRLSDKTLQKTLKNSFVAQLASEAYGRLAHVCAQGEADGARYRQLGVVDHALCVTGNVKFDMVQDAEKVAQGARLAAHAGARKNILMASTRDGEEAAWLAALAQNPLESVRWWLVPRHPQRFDAVRQLLQQAGFVGEKLLLKTQLDVLTGEEKIAALQAADVVLGNTMGEMPAYYAAADVVMMGGAWLPHGGQNFLEPMALGKPTVVGAHTHNFTQAADDAVAAQALLQVADIDAGLRAVRELLNDDGGLGLRAKAFVAAHQGAVRRTLEIVA